MRSWLLVLACLVSGGKVGVEVRIRVIIRDGG